jgi:hypothetical protein
MKTTVPVQKHPGHFVPVLTLAVCIFAATFSASGSPATHARPQPVDTILVQKQIISKKHKIKLYPSNNQQVLLFSATGEEGKVYQLFLFDIDGKLAKQVNIRNKQTTVLNSIEKGNYLFEVFSDDERIENGQVIIR